MKQVPITDACAEKLAVADASRLAPLEALMAAQDYTEILSVPRDRLPHHWRVRRDAGLVTSCRDGKAVRCAIAEASLTSPAAALDKKVV
jgi:DNA-binding transcriptional ArsR family regulator